MARKFASRAITTYGSLSHRMLYMMLLTSLSLEIAENLFLDFSRFVILIFIALRGSQSIPPHAQLWGENNIVIYELSAKRKDGE